MIRFLALLLALATSLSAQQAGRVRLTAMGDNQSSGIEGGPFSPSVHLFGILNQGPNPVAFTAGSPATWLTVTPASGSVVKSQVVKATIDSDANSLAEGVYTGTVSITVAGAGTFNYDITLSISGATPFMVPGGGWGGPTTEPGQIGSGTARVVARWDVVQHLSVAEADDPTYPIGVVAFHIAGIEKVAIGVDGGTFVDVITPTLNPKTGVWEYVANLQLSDFTSDGEIEIRAIAYPNASAPPAQGTGTYPGGGFVRLLGEGTTTPASLPAAPESLMMYLDVDAKQAEIAKHCSPNGSDSTGDGTAGNPYLTPWKAAQEVDVAGGGDAGGGFVYMLPGTYTLQVGSGAVPDAAERWVTFTPAPGVPQDQVKIANSGYPGIRIDKVRLYRTTNIGQVHGGDGVGDVGWADQVIFQGSGIATQTDDWFRGWIAAYLTDCEMYDSVGTIPGRVDLCRGLTAARVQYGPAVPRCIINSTYDTINSGGTGNHPDFLHYNFAGTSENSLVYGLVGTNIDATGIFLKDMSGGVSNTAIVNVIVDVGVAGSQMGENVASINHFLFWNVTHEGSAVSWALPQSSMSNISIQGSYIGSHGFVAGGTGVDDLWYHENHFGPSTTIAPGSNVTVGDPVFGVGFHPLAGSPLLGRVSPLLVPVDAEGTPRPTPGAVGALEQ